MSNTSARRAPYKKGLRADYRGATPEQVARAMMRPVGRVEVESVEAPSSPIRSLVQRIVRTFALRARRA